MVRHDSATKSTSGVREQSKARRRTAILDGTLALLRTTHIDNVSMEAIAAEAQVAPATVYNLMGSRDQLLLACANRVLESLVDGLITMDLNEDPIGVALAIIERSCDAFTSDSHAFRQIVSAANGLARGGQTIEMDPAQLQVSAMRAAQQAGIIRHDADPSVLGRQVYLSYNGAMFAWAANQLTDNGFRATATHGLWTVLAAFTTDEYRAQYVKKSMKVAKEIVAAGYGSTSFGA